MYLEAGNNLPQKLEIHYHLANNTHQINAFVRNRCEHELIELIKHVGAIFEVDILLDAEPLLEGGIIDRLNFIIKANPFLAVVIIPVVMGIVSSKLSQDQELIDLQKDYYRLRIEEIKKNKSVDSSKVVEIVPFFNSDVKIRKKRSNFYNSLKEDCRVDKIEVSALNSLAKPTGTSFSANRSEFDEFILKNDDLPTQTDESAILKIVAPVLVDLNYKWKGIYQEKLIDFRMADQSFKQSVVSEKESFKNGTYIECILKISSKIDDTGEVYAAGYTVTTVIKKDDGTEVEITPQGKRYLTVKKLAENQIKMDFDT